MKKDVENLIDRLASKELTFGCRIRWTDCGEGIVVKNDMIARLVEVLWDASGRSGFISPDWSFEILGHDIFIGDVLEKMGLNWAKKAVDEHLHNTGWILEKAQADLLNLWQPCGFTKSLQQIFSEAVWEEVCAAVKDCQPVPHRIDEPVCEKCGGTNIVKITTAEIKQPHIRELFTFLIQTFPVS